MLFKLAHNVLQIGDVAGLEALNCQVKNKVLYNHHRSNYNFTRHVSQCAVMGWLVHGIPFFNFYF
jgi:hypothetical protein